MSTNIEFLEYQVLGNDSGSCDLGIVFRVPEGKVFQLITALRHAAENHSASTVCSGRATCSKKEELVEALKEGEASPVAEGYSLNRVLDRIKSTPKVEETSVPAPVVEEPPVVATESHVEADRSDEPPAASLPKRRGRPPKNKYLAAITPAPALATGDDEFAKAEQQVRELAELSRMQTPEPTVDELENFTDDDETPAQHPLFAATRLRDVMEWAYSQGANDPDSIVKLLSEHTDKPEVAKIAPQMVAKVTRAHGVMQDERLAQRLRRRAHD